VRNGSQTERKGTTTWEPAVKYVAATIVAEGSGNMLRALQADALEAATHVAPTKKNYPKKPTVMHVLRKVDNTK
jgi:hypothetical protein